MPLQNQIKCIFCERKITLSHISRHIKTAHPNNIRQWDNWKKYNHMYSSVYHDWRQARKQRRKQQMLDKLKREIIIIQNGELKK